MPTSPGLAHPPPIRPSSPPERGFAAPSSLPTWHVGVVAAGLVAATGAVQGTGPSGWLVAAAGLGAGAVYAGTRLVGDGDGGADEAAGARWTWVALAGLLAVAALGRLPRLAWGAAALVALPVGLDLYRRGRPPSRVDAWAKPVLVALGWTVGAVLVPLSAVRDAAGPVVDARLAWHAGAVACAVAANVLASDLADRHRDAASGRVSSATRWRASAVRAAGGAIGLAGAVCAWYAGADLSPAGRALLGLAPALAAAGALWPPRRAGARVALDLAVGAGGLALGLAALGAA